MVKAAILRHSATWVVAVTTACFGMTGLASAATGSSTGPNSPVRVWSDSFNTCEITNNNDVSYNNVNNQTAVTGSVTAANNTSVGGNVWSGWSALDPASAQANQQSYNSWWSGLMSWLSVRASGTNWTATGSNTTWTPSGSNWQATWNNWDPMTWQANGQSFTNWYAQIMPYLNSSSANWMLTWPASATGNSGMGGVSSGNATNNYNASMTISINNSAAPSVAGGGSNACGFTAGGGGMGGGGSTTGPNSPVTVSNHNFNRGSVGNNNTVRGSSSNGQFAGSGGVSGFNNTGLGGGHSGNAGNHASTPASVGVNNGGGQGGGTPSTPPAGGSGGGNTASSMGPNSPVYVSSHTSNSFTQTNTNNISFTSSNNQTATTGNTTAVNNTSVGGAGSGSATNNAGSGGAVSVKN